MTEKMKILINIINLKNMVRFALLTLCLPAHAQIESIQNLVLDPPYGELKNAQSQDEDEDKYEYEDEKIKIEKLEYGPTNDEKPILIEKKKPVEIKGGLQYDESFESVIEPEPSFLIRDEKIVERDAESVSQEP